MEKVTTIVYPKDFFVNYKKAVKYWTTKQAAISNAYERVAKKNAILDCGAVFAGFVSVLLLIYGLVSFAILVSLYRDGAIEQFNRLILPLCTGIPVLVIFFGVYYVVNRKKNHRMAELKVEYEMLALNAMDYGFVLGDVRRNSIHNAWKDLTMLENFKKNNVQTVDVRRKIDSPVYTSYTVSVTDPGVEGEFTFTDNYEKCPADITETADFSFLDDIKLYPEMIE